MSQFPALGLSKVIHWLSGDQRGLPTVLSLKDVNSTGLRPSLSDVQIDCRPERPQLKTIFLPSGENCGSKSGWVDAIKRVAGPFLFDELGPGVRQMFESLEYRE